MNVFVLIDWDDRVAIAAFKDREYAEALLESDYTEEDDITIEELPVGDEDDE